ncbi:hypothetical protein FRC05_007641 [Tulasnella sp. 425]|nr:hypothetical protein FRC05_007641 [Tulasnella sp. 425]
MAASSRPRSPIPEAVYSDQLLVASANASGQRWDSAKDFTLSLAIQIPGRFPSCVSKFTRVYSLPVLQNHQRFLLQCAVYSDPSAKSVIGTDYDVATVLIRKVETSNWTAVVVRLVGKGGELEEAKGKLRSGDIPFEGCTVTADQVTKEKPRRKRLGMSFLRRSFGSSSPNLKRKRNRYKSIEAEARRLAKTARNAGQKYVVADDDRKQLARHFAETPRGVSWEDSFASFVDNKEEAGRWSYPICVNMLRKEKKYFEREVSMLRCDVARATIRT